MPEIKSKYLKKIITITISKTIIIVELILKIQKINFNLYRPGLSALTWEIIHCPEHTEKYIG